MKIIPFLFVMMLGVSVAARDITMDAGSDIIDLIPAEERDTLTTLVIDGDVRPHQLYKLQQLPKLRYVSLPAVDYVGSQTFRGMDSLRQVEFRGLIGHIDGYQFYDCPQLRRVVFDGPINTTGTKMAINYRRLESIDLNGLVLSLGAVEYPDCPALVLDGLQDRAIFSGDESAVRPVTLAAIAADTSMMADFNRLAEYQMAVIHNEDAEEFLRKIAYSSTDEMAEFADSLGLTELSERLAGTMDDAAGYDFLKSKLELLQESAPYAADSVAFDFTYVMDDDPSLDDARRYFDLDSIAGDGDDISRMKRLMYWVHDLVRHDGSSYNPDVPRSLRHLARVCHDEDRGVNCRMMAIMLTEALLAEGIPARYLTCQSKAWDTDNDCHVICVGWSDSLGKWVWLDPTFAAYVTDENGVPLHPGEVRYRLQNNLPLVLNDDANWNHQSAQTFDNYLMKYMAKNLYVITANSINQSEPEGKGDCRHGQFVTLAPVGFDYESTGGVLTTDERRFWAAPVR
ncbi:MAG: transglutaminase domain-containing protein [Bacteroidales bacterium]|nr:transglutaminase domain-containing protein [Bacteroidales bacterium]